jgi:hypothetical protein
MVKSIVIRISTTRATSENGKLFSLPNRRLVSNPYSLIELKTQAVAHVTFSSSSFYVDRPASMVVSLLKTPDPSNPWIIFTMIVKTSHSSSSNTTTDTDKTSIRTNHNVERQKIREACMDRYLKSNRACDGKGMAQVFHPLSRLIQIPNPESSSSTINKNEIPTVVISQSEFCHLVQIRYESLQHAAYANVLNKDQYDTWLGSASLNKSLAIGHLRVGHLPFVWSDLLLLAKLKDQYTRRPSLAPESCNEDECTWWILAKTSHAQPFSLQTMPRERESRRSDDVYHRKKCWQTKTKTCLLDYNC